MPELPEVENVARMLRPAVVGRQVVEARVLWPRSIARPTPEAFCQEVVGREVLSVARRGKVLTLGLTGGRWLLVHLRMSGRLLLERVGEPAPVHLRVALGLDDDRELRFVDPRKFGRLWLVGDPEEVLGGLGPEPLDVAFTVEALRARLAGRQARIKPLLLDQRFLAGIGNIYADEALFLAGVHPCRPAASLTEEEVGRLHMALREVLEAAILDGGTTLSAYRRPDGSPGEHQALLRVFRRAGEPCPRCGTPVVRARVGGRGTYFCPRCQVYRAGK
ncbi:MAG: bifunctional DNA-formamidopyrimidine glycosylase/DNA-(apurinic or apyrimidinic site) lyase [Anaerolineae bacterium]